MEAAKRPDDPTMARRARERAVFETGLSRTASSVEELRTGYDESASLFLCIVSSVVSLLFFSCISVINERFVRITSFVRGFLRGRQQVSGQVLQQSERISVVGVRIKEEAPAMLEDDMQMPAMGALGPDSAVATCGPPVTRWLAVAFTPRLRQCWL